MRATVMKTLGVDESLVDSILNESLIDPRPAIEPFARPIFAQLELSLAYLATKHSLKLDKAFLMGMGPGASYLSAYAEESLKLKLVSPDTFNGLVIDKGVKVADSPSYLVALGAAIAGAEVSA
jgi:Tfp pilus assembly PilM family ATPase